MRNVDDQQQPSRHRRRGPGQPRIGQPVKVVIPDDQVAALDAMVEAGQARTRSEAIRQVLTTALS